MIRAAVMLMTIVAAAGFAGCSNEHVTERYQPQTASQIRYSVFEVAAGDADSVVPRESRRPIAESSYELAVIPRETAEELQRLTLADSGPLVNHDLTADGWPYGRADGWAYSRADSKVLGGGTANGSVGVRGKEPHREFRINYKVVHTVNSAGQVDPAARIDAPIFYQGELPQGQAAVFLAPFTRADGRRVSHVIAFKTDAAR
jgi:hypothetical protein